MLVEEPKEAKVLNNNTTSLEFTSLQSPFICYYTCSANKLLYTKHPEQKIFSKIGVQKVGLHVNNNNTTSLHFPFICYYTCSATNYCTQNTQNKKPSQKLVCQRLGCM